MSWDNGGLIDTMVECAPPELRCKSEICNGVVAAPVESAENGYYGNGNVWCACCGHSWEVDEEWAEYAQLLEEEFRKAGF